MKNLMTRLEKGQTVECGYRRASWVSTFVGFSEGDEMFDNWEQLKAAKGAKSFGDDCRALFADTDGTQWEAYRYNGYWAVGSSADRLRIKG